MFSVKKLNLFHLLCLSNIDREKVFGDVLDRKEVFKDSKNIRLWKTQNLNFLSNWLVQLSLIMTAVLVNCFKILGA